MSISPTTFNFSATGQDPSNSPVTSQNFNAADADVIFESSDHVHFHIHRKNLEAHAGAFPPAEIETKGEIVPLTEGSSTLEHLFHYVYPQRHPKINLLPSSDFFELAEAAEKYEVFNLMDLCHSQMTQIATQHPTEAFAYGSKHDYPDVLNLASPLLLDIPLDEIVERLDTEFVRPWVRYRQAWGSAAEKAIESTLQKLGDYCHNCRRTQSRHVCIRLGQPLSRQSLLDLIGLSGTSNRCSYCSYGYNDTSQYDSVIQELEKALDAVPAFSTFM